MTTSASPTQCPVWRRGESGVRASTAGGRWARDTTVDQGVLTISAERKEKTEERKSDNYRSEFRHGHFERQIRLPEGTSPDVICARYRDDAQEVRLPAPMEGPSAHKIDVQRG